MRQLLWQILTVATLTQASLATYVSFVVLAVSHVSSSQIMLSCGLVLNQENDLVSTCPLSLDAVQ